MTVTTLQYVRTPQGRAAAFTSDARLSSKLKSVLKAVDGRTSVSALVIQFPEHDAADLLRQLEAAGLIKLREERLSDFQPSGFMSDLVDLPNSASITVSSFAATSAAGLTPLQTLAEMLPPEPLAGLPRIVDVMATFVLTHCPQQAFSVLARLEGFQTLDELNAGLPEYSLLANACGAAGVVHLAELTERMREASAA